MLIKCATKLMMTKINEMTKTIFLGGVSFILTPWSFRFSNINLLPYWKEDYVFFILRFHEDIY
jgi:hypothetical protein